MNYSTSNWVSNCKLHQERVKEQMIAKQILLVRKEQKRQQAELALVKEKHTQDLEKLEAKQQPIRQKQVQSKYQ